jgi:TPR repeat protein
MFHVVAKALAAGRPGVQHAGMLSKETMDQASLLLYRCCVKESNCSRSKFEIGLSYSVGSCGQEQNFFKAFEYFESGANHDHNLSLYSLAAFYQTAIGGVVERDLKYAESLRARMSDQVDVTLGFYVPGLNDSPELFDTAGQAAMADRFSRGTE